MNPINSSADLDRALAEPVAVLFKHSTRCPISARAHKEVTALHEQRPETPIYLLDVNAQSGLSQSVAERFRIGHDSPQAIVLRAGQPSWSASHHDITAKKLDAELDG